MKSNILLIGCGDIGYPLAQAILEKKQANHLFITRKDVSAGFGGLENNEFCTTGDDIDGFSSVADIIIIAVRPKDVASILKKICPTRRNQIIVSLAAAKSISYINEIAECDSPIVRVMTNIGIVCGKAVNFLSSEEKFSKERLKIAELFSNMGCSIMIPDSKMNLATISGGSMPAIIAYLLKSFEEKGEFSKSEQNYYINLVKSSIIEFLVENRMYEPERITDALFECIEELRSKHGMSLESIIRKVSTPGGCTEHILKSMETGQQSEIIVDSQTEPEFIFSYYIKRDLSSGLKKLDQM